MCIPQAQIEETFAQKPEPFGSGFFVLMGRAPANDLSWGALVYVFKLGLSTLGLARSLSSRSFLNADFETASAADTVPLSTSDNRESSIVHMPSRLPICIML